MDKQQIDACLDIGNEAKHMPGAQYKEATYYARLILAAPSVLDLAPHRPRPHLSVLPPHTSPIAAWKLSTRNPRPPSSPREVTSRISLTSRRGRRRRATKRSRRTTYRQVRRLTVRFRYKRLNVTHAAAFRHYHEVCARQCTSSRAGANATLGSPVLERAR